MGYSHLEPVLYPPSEPPYWSRSQVYCCIIHPGIFMKCWASHCGVVIYSLTITILCTNASTRVLRSDLQLQIRRDEGGPCVKIKNKASTRMYVHFAGYPHVFPFAGNRCRVSIYKFLIHFTLSKLLCTSTIKTPQLNVTRFHLIMTAGLGLLVLFLKISSKTWHCCIVSWREYILILSTRM